jgi:electron transfer flavoprotein beta subunit
MKIAIILGRVLNPAGIVVNRRRGRIFVNREEYVMQPADRCALEAALQIKDGSEAEVIALPRDLLSSDDVQRQALSMGADRAICFTGQASNLTYGDAAMARVLASTVARLGGIDLILTGATTLDTGQSQLGSRLAEALGWPQVVDAWAVRVIDDHAEVVCQEGLGYVTFEADLPAVVTVHPGALKPRYPDGVRLINVYRDAGAVEQWDVAELVDTGDLVPLLEKRGRDFPPERERGVRLEGSSQEMAEALAGELKKRIG